MTDQAIATVEDAMDMLKAGGVDLAGELSNITTAYSDITEELEREGYTEIGFSTDDLASAIRAHLSYPRLP